MTITTTLAEIRSHNPCANGFAKIRDHFGVSSDEAKTHNEPFPVALLLETNGLGDALWVTAHVAPQAVTRFLIRRLDEGEYSALKTLRGLDGNFSRQIKAVEAVVSLLHRQRAGEDVREELRDAADAADAAADAAAYADRAASVTANAAADAAAAAAATYAAARAAYAAAHAAAAAADAAADAAAAARAAYAAAHAAAAAADAAADAAAAARAAARDDLIAALEAE